MNIDICNKEIINNIIDKIYLDLFELKMKKSLLYSFFNFNLKINFIKLTNVLDYLNIKLSEINFNNLSLNKKYLIKYKYDNNFNYAILTKIDNNTFNIYFQNGEFNKYTLYEISNFENLSIYEYKKINCRLSKYDFLTKLKKINFKTNFLLIVFELFMFLLMLIGNLYFKLIIDYIIKFNLVRDGILISISFFLIFILHSLSEWIIKIYKYKLINRFIIEYYDFFMEKLSLKNHSFFNDNNKDKIVNIYNTFSELIKYQINFLPNFISDIIMVMSSIIFIGLINYYYLAISIISMLGMLIFCIIGFRNNNMFYNLLLSKSTQVNLDLLNFIDYRINNFNLNNLSKLVQKNLNNIYDFQQDEKQFIYLSEQNSFFKSIFNKLIFIIYLIISFYTIIKYQNTIISISTVIYSISIIGILNESLEGIFDFCSEVPQRKISGQMFHNFIFSHNMINKGNKAIDCVKNIRFLNFSYTSNNKMIFNKLNLEILNDTLIFGKSGVGKTTLLKSILINNFNDNILINNIPYNLINLNFLKHKLVYYSHEQKNNFFSLELLNKYRNEIIEIFNYFGIDLNVDFNKNSQGQKQVINFISLLECNNKILLLDEPLSHVDDKGKKLILNVIKPILLKSNFLIYVSHDLSIRNFFKHKFEFNNSGE